MPSPSSTSGGMRKPMVFWMRVPASHEMPNDQTVTLNAPMNCTRNWVRSPPPVNRPMP